MSTNTLTLDGHRFHVVGRHPDGTPAEVTNVEDLPIDAAICLAYTDGLQGIDQHAPAVFPAGSRFPMDRL